MNFRIYSQLLYLTPEAVPGWTFFKCPAERKAAKRWLPSMRGFLQIVCLLLLSACTSNSHSLRQSGSTIFRVSFNLGRELTDSESDSIEHSKPFHVWQSGENKFYELLSKKRIVSNDQLDTAGLKFSIIDWNTTKRLDKNLTIRVDTAAGKEYLIANHKNKISKTELGPMFLGDRFFCYLDIDGDGRNDLIIMEKYYLMNGYNFDLKMFQFD